jgi:hypothetical protein
MDELGVGGEIEEFDHLRQVEQRRRCEHDRARHRDDGADCAIVVALLFVVRLGGRLFLQRRTIGGCDAVVANGLLLRRLDEGRGLRELMAVAERQRKLHQHSEKREPTAVPDV